MNRRRDTVTDVTINVEHNLRNPSFKFNPPGANSFSYNVFENENPGFLIATLGAEDLDVTVSKTIYSKCSVFYMT